MFRHISGSMLSAQIKNHPKFGQDYVKQHAVHNHTHTLKTGYGKEIKVRKLFFLHNTHESTMCTHWTAACFEVGICINAQLHMPDASSFIRTNCEFPVEIVFRYVESPKCVVDNLFTQIDFCPLSILSQRGNGTNEAQCLRSLKNFVKLDWKI